MDIKIQKLVTSIKKLEDQLTEKKAELTVLRSDCEHKTTKHFNLMYDECNQCGEKIRK